MYIKGFGGIVIKHLNTDQLIALEPRNRFPTWRAGTPCYIGSRNQPLRIDSRARIFNVWGGQESIPPPPAYVAWRAGTSNMVFVPARESIPGLLKRLQIRALASINVKLKVGLFVMQRALQYYVYGYDDGQPLWNICLNFIIGMVYEERIKGRDFCSRSH